tara:strand:- start:549 stop:1460 length:912 start_codon:yes stop_codon:yes gene_type:complete
MGKFKIKPMFAAASPGKSSVNKYDAQGKIIISDKTEGNEGVKGVKGEAAIYDTGKSLKGLSDEQKDWRTKEIDKLGGLENYHKKYGNSKTGKLVKEEIKAVEETPATKGGETGKVVATTAVDKDQLDINEQRTENRESRLNTRQLKQTQIKKARNNYDPKIHGDNKRAYMKSVKQQAKNTMHTQNEKNLQKAVSNDYEGKGTGNESTYKTEENKNAKNISKGEHDAAQLKAAENGVTTSGVEDTPPSVVEHKKNSSGTKFGNFLRGKGFNKTDKDGKKVTTGTNKNDHASQDSSDEELETTSL